ncbi:response regulator [Rhizobium mesoamericanum]|uniref:response regulator n=1 Tax=Rhizobium mesoamericanum TaxID=1079800 RepID=UPI0027D84FC8|nr:response regulator [Rhizobium mesoamericanum]
MIAHYSLPGLRQRAPRVTEPKATGYESELLHGEIEYRLKGKIETNCRPKGLELHLRFPTWPGAPLPPDLRILIVEDEFLIATDLAQTLRDEGYAIAGPVPSVREALMLIDEGAVAAAVLDIHLNDEHSYPVADQLAHRGIPFLFLTSYVKADLPERFKNRPLISKLADVQAVVVVLQTFLA